MADRKRLHNNSEYRRRAAIQEGIDALREVLCENTTRQTKTKTATLLSNMEGFQPHQSTLSRPEVVSKAVRKIEELSKSISRLKRQQNALVIENQRLKRNYPHRHNYSGVIFLKQ